MYQITLHISRTYHLRLLQERLVVGTLVIRLCMRFVYEEGKGGNSHLNLSQILKTMCASHMG